MGELIKTCTKCFVEKPLSEFWNRKNGKFGKNSKCSECMRKPESEKKKHVGVPPIIVKKIDFVVEENGCYRCISHTSKRGYPAIQRNKKVTLISRFIYEECFGPIPEGLVIRHKCDNPFCINPEHLETGTMQDNVRDMVERNRQAKGSRVGGSKLTEKDVLEIKRLIKRGLSDTQIAKKFKVSITTINYIKNGKNWKHLKEGVSIGSN
jgi:hypothetical protein